MHCHLITPSAALQAWQDEQRLLVGTKCNKLLQWDTASGALRSVPLPPPPPRQHPVVESVWGSCGIHSVAVNPAGDLVATGGAEPADAAVLGLPDFEPVQTLVVSHSCWVLRGGAVGARLPAAAAWLALGRACLVLQWAGGAAWACVSACPPACLCVRPSAARAWPPVVAISRSPAPGVAAWRGDRPRWVSHMCGAQRPSAPAHVTRPPSPAAPQGHQDWVFGMAWVSDRHLVTGSRDQSVALWHVPEPGSGAPAEQYKTPGAPGPAGLQRKFEVGAGRQPGGAHGARGAHPAGARDAGQLCTRVSRGTRAAQCKAGAMSGPLQPEPDVGAGRRGRGEAVAHALSTLSPIQAR